MVANGGQWWPMVVVLVLSVDPVCPLRLAQSWNAGQFFCEWSVARKRRWFTARRELPHYTTDRSISYATYTYTATESQLLVGYDQFLLASTIILYVAGRWVCLLDCPRCVAGVGLSGPPSLTWCHSMHISFTLYCTFAPSIGPNYPLRPVGGYQPQADTCGCQRVPVAASRRVVKRLRVCAIVEFKCQVAHKYALLKVW